MSVSHKLVRPPFMAVTLSDSVGIGMQWEEGCTQRVTQGKETHKEGDKHYLYKAMKSADLDLRMPTTVLTIAIFSEVVMGPIKYFDLN